MAVKIDFHNGLPGKESRMYRLSTDKRQYFLSELKEEYDIEEKDGVEISRTRTTDDKGNPTYREVNKRTHQKIDYVKKGYVEREQYDCNAESFEQLGDIIMQACLVSLSIEETINAAINKK